MFIKPNYEPNKLFSSKKKPLQNSQKHPPLDKAHSSLFDPNNFHQPPMTGQFFLSRARRVFELYPTEFEGPAEIYPLSPVYLLLPILLEKGSRSQFLSYVWKFRRIGFCLTYAQWPARFSCTIWQKLSSPTEFYSRIPSRYGAPPPKRQSSARYMNIVTEFINNPTLPSSWLFIIPV